MPKATATRERARASARSFEKERNQIGHFVLARAGHDQHAARRYARPRRPHPHRTRPPLRRARRRWPGCRPVRCARAGTPQRAQLRDVLLVDGIGARERLAKTPAREFVREGFAPKQARARARRACRVAAQIEHGIGARGHVGAAAAEREAHVVARRHHAHVRKERARDLGLASGRVIVGHEEQGDLALRRLPEQGAHQRPHPACELAGAVAGQRDLQRACGSIPNNVAGSRRRCRSCCAPPNAARAGSRRRSRRRPRAREDPPACTARS
jgi:hypothetical protein